MKTINVREVAGFFLVAAFIPLSAWTMGMEPQGPKVELGDGFTGTAPAAEVLDGQRKLEGVELAAMPDGTRAGDSQNAAANQDQVHAEQASAGAVANSVITTVDADLLSKVIAVKKFMEDTNKKEHQDFWFDKMDKSDAGTIHYVRRFSLTDTENPSAETPIMEFRIGPELENYTGPAETVQVDVHTGAVTLAAYMTPTKPGEADSPWQRVDMTPEQIIQFLSKEVNGWTELWKPQATSNQPTTATAPTNLGSAANRAQATLPINPKAVNFDHAAGFLGEATVPAVPTQQEIERTRLAKSVLSILQGIKTLPQNHTPNIFTVYHADVYYYDADVVTALLGAIPSAIKTLVMSGNTKAAVKVISKIKQAPFWGPDAGRIVPGGDIIPSDRNLYKRQNVDTLVEAALADLQNNTSAQSTQEIDRRALSESVLNILQGIKTLRQNHTPNISTAYHANVYYYDADAVNALLNGIPPAIQNLITTGNTEAAVRVISKIKQVPFWGPDAGAIVAGGSIIPNDQNLYRRQDVDVFVDAALAALKK